ncbi:arabinogalactan oligomer / maltooligosaccharide transport system permease protein [Candidatus Hakubella thermalkaliphila]|uniref:Maltose/maltodextrin transport system permease protein n=1 Tax=Candidatus Hakubella thermalkaliphila TaxID=2754717 RepID=A0A6V8NGT6_9ACTN|nr:arabinogalactan oligomer / maltooligosaccharide transport system permease protein [Candidatus Hakubella thermalkaliphila]
MSSTYCMGLGQLYNRQFGKGILFAAVEILFIVYMLPFVSRGLWGLVTLGEIPQRMEAGKILPGDHSIFLMIYGIMSVLLLLVFAAIYVMNYFDARRVGEQRDKGKPVKNIINSIATLYEKGFPYLVLTPAGIFLLFLTVLPLIFGMLIAFTNYSGPHNVPPRALVDWVGFKIFMELFRLPLLRETFFGVAAWTITWALAATFTTFFEGLIMAVLINRHGIKLKRFWRTIYILPWAMPGFISILIMRNMFNGHFGPINRYLEFIGLPAVPWFAETEWARTTAIIVNLWLGFPYFMAMMSGVISGISKDLYEAADVEGASSRQQFWKITVPLVLYMTAPLLIMGFAFNFNNFNMIYLLTSGLPSNASYFFAGDTDIFLSWIYKLTLERSQFHLASAVSIIIFIFLAGISIYNFKNTRAFKEEGLIQ